MGKRKKREDLGIARPAMGLVGGAAILGIGSTVAVKAGGSGAGMSAMASFMPAMGTTVGAGLTVQQLRKLEKQTKRRRR